ncbi:hypothetical protein DL768_007880 [Monosporascus sp. mg162]|nr:hypothetical protein DL768_007880 [Monosporascus sp. mg162]
MPGHSLTGDSYTDSRMTVEACQNYCFRNNYPLSGIRCGGPTHLSFFDPTNFVYAVNPIDVGSWEKHACFMEPKWDTLLERLVYFERNHRRIGVCTDVCAGNGFTVAGLQAGRECWCGHSLDSKYRKDANDRKCRITCDMVCRGNKRQVVDDAQVYKTPYAIGEESFI